MNPPRVYTCSPSWTPPPPRTIPLGHPSAPALSILYPASNLDWRFVSYMILYMFQCYSPKSSHPLPLPQSPKDCSIHLCLFCCLAYRVIITTCLNSIYICIQLLKDDAVKVLHSICQQIWKTQPWPQDWKSSVFIPIPKKGNAKECSNYRTIALISHASKVMLTILQANAAFWRSIASSPLNW